MKPNLAHPRRTLRAVLIVSFTANRRATAPLWLYPRQPLPKKAGLCMTRYYVIKDKNSRSPVRRCFQLVFVVFVMMTSSKM
jgi:hypothetical protein